MLQVEVKPTADKAVLDASRRRSSRTSRVTGAVNGAETPAAMGRPPPWLQRHGASCGSRWALTADVRVAAVPFKVGRETYPAGSFLLPASAGTPTSPMP